MSLCPTSVIFRLTFPPSLSLPLCVLVLTDNSTATSSSYAEFTVDVLLVVNKITEGSIRSLEQLTMMGILPGILRLLEETSSVIVAIKENERRFVASRDKPPSYTSMAFSTFLPNSLLLTSPPNMDCRKDRLEVPPCAMEAARFIHKISSASSMTLQVNIQIPFSSIL